MTGTRRFDIKGMDQLIRKLRMLPVHMQNKLERGALKKALLPVKVAAERKAPIGETGNLAENFKIQTRTKRNVITGKLVSDAPHAHLVEFGHRKFDFHGKEIKGERVAAHPFMRPALDESADEALDTFGAEVEKALDTMDL